MNLENFYYTRTDYAITINPMDKYQFFNKDDRFQRFRNFMYAQLIGLDGHGVKYTFYIEISEPRGHHTQGYMGPRLHLHGTITFPTKAALGYWLLYGYSMLCKIGDTDVDTIQDKDLWQQYCSKQRLFKNNILSTTLFPGERSESQAP